MAGMILPLVRLLEKMQCSAMPIPSGMLEMELMPRSSRFSVPSQEKKGLPMEGANLKILYLGKKLIRVWN